MSPLHCIVVTPLKQYNFERTPSHFVHNLLRPTVLIEIIFYVTSLTANACSISLVPLALAEYLLYVKAGKYVSFVIQRSVVTASGWFQIKYQHIFYLKLRTSNLPTILPIRLYYFHPFLFRSIAKL